MAVNTGLHTHIFLGGGGLFFMQGSFADVLKRKEETGRDLAADVGFDLRSPCPSGICGTSFPAGDRHMTLFPLT